jgi:hypothetical protein
MKYGSLARMSDFVIILILWSTVSLLRCSSDSVVKDEDELESWFRKVGGVLNKCKYDKINRRMVATEDIKEGETLVMANFSFLFPFRKSTGVISDRDMALYLQNNTDPFWKTYLDSLPKTCQTPVCGNIVSNATLVNTTAFFERYITQELHSLDNRMDLAIKLSLVLSRGWKHRGMLPIFDRFNHDSEKGLEVVFTTDGTEMIYLSAKVDYSVGDEVFDYYGNHTSVEWLYNWNMLSENTKYDTCVDYVFSNHVLHTDKKKRAKCIAETGDQLLFEDVVKEMKTALNTVSFHDDPNKADLSTILGLSSWITKKLE